MGIHSVKPGQTTVGNVSQPVAPEAEKSPARTAGSEPSLKMRSVPSAKKASGTTARLDVHSEPRITVRSDTELVHQLMGSKAALIEGIDPQRLSGFYKHASMIANDKADDKNFLLECLTHLYLSAPDSSHPNATDPEWVDDQDVLWGDELLFLFEVSPQLERLEPEGKRYFADSLAGRAGTDRQHSGSVDALEQALLKASRRMALAD